MENDYSRNQKNHENQKIVCKSIAEQMRFEGKELIFLMPRPDSKVAKGNKITYRKWCEKYDIKVFSTKEIKELKKWTKIK